MLAPPPLPHRTLTKLTTLPSHCHRFNIYKYNGVGPLAQHASDTLLEEVRPSVPTQNRSHPARFMYLHVACFVCHHLCLPRRSNGAQANPMSFLIAHRRVAGVTKPRLPLYVGLIVCVLALSGRSDPKSLTSDGGVTWQAGGGAGGGAAKRSAGVYRAPGSSGRVSAMMNVSTNTHTHTHTA